MPDLAVIWKISIIQNNYNCTKCGNQLFDANKNAFTGGAGLDPDDMEVVHCMGCGLIAGIARERPKGDVKLGEIQQYKGAGK